jgi:hypothetical protein
MLQKNWRIKMPMYQVSYSYEIPEWGTIELEADSEDQARELAMDEIEFSYPEISNIEISKVEQMLTRVL